ncbi:hypothetical protein CC80DRAFT_536700 [Byssothecium circinans]|uniref:FAR1 domain-containing protein n=1 Tax=Byssothecium circinans TaxID=147558 RepID=A0A6A5TP84_9PLEO|nr:hypothetical protein CC80DRAFT_536700 [Byssothecium circinans]
MRHKTRAISDQLLLSRSIMEEGIPPPPDCLYPSYEEAYDSLKSHGIQHGYGFHFNQSRPTNSKVKTRYFYYCDKSRVYESKATKLKTSSRATGCLFRLIIYKTKKTSGCGRSQTRITTISHQSILVRTTAIANVHRQSIFNQRPDW